jgi:hypothetical protein
LDWVPLSRPKEGREEEFWILTRRLGDPELTEADRLTLLEAITMVSVTPAEVVGAPQIGKDLQADDWYRERRRSEGWNDAQIAAGLRLMHGYHVLELAPACDGLPEYSNGQPFGRVDRHSFRADLLNVVEHVVGSELVESAYHSKHADELVAYGQLLLQAANDFAWRNRIDPRLRPPGQFNEDSPLWQYDIVRSAALWCLYWGQRGHGLHALW